MSDKKVNRELIQRAGTYVFSTVTGAAVSVAAVLLFASVMYALQFPLYFAGYFSLLALGLGCMTSGFICGKIKRHSGLKLGLQCSIILLALCALGALIGGSLSGSEIIPKLLTAVITGCTGGVLGVNRD